MLVLWHGSARASIVPSEALGTWDHVIGGRFEGDTPSWLDPRYTKPFRGRQEALRVHRSMRGGQGQAARARASVCPAARARSRFLVHVEFDWTWRPERVGDTAR